MLGSTNKIVGFSTNTSANPCAMLRYHADAHPVYKISSTITSHPAWKAFHAGMKILQRHAGSSPIDALSIAKSNLKLLHRSLSQDESFTRAIKTVQNEGMKNHLPTVQHLYTEQGAWAELITLQDGDSISLAKISQLDTMYLLMSGNAQLTPTKGPCRLTQRWWNRIGIINSNNALHSGDIIATANREKQQNSGVLTAVGKNCLLLRIRTSLVADSAQNYRARPSR